VISYDMQSKGAQAYLALAGEMLRRNRRLRRHEQGDGRPRSAEQGPLWGCDRPRMPPDADRMAF